MSQSSQFHEVYAHLRDHKRGAERAAIGDALERADRIADALREQLRDLDNPAGRLPPKPAAKPVRAYKPADLDARARLDFHKAMIAQLGGSLTVAPAAGCQIEPYLRHIR